MKPLALDLCCGKGGWTIGLLKAGWDVIGVDIEDMGGYPSHLVFADVREIAKDIQAYFPALKFDLVVASPPCQEFSVSFQPFRRSRAKFNDANPPDRSIWDACVAIAAALKAPLILENVLGARKWMGRETWTYGSYYFWGEMPALKPIPFLKENGKWSHRKGFHRAKKGSGNQPTGGYKCDPLDNSVYLGNSNSWKGCSRARDNFHAQGERGHAIQREPFPGEKERIEGLATANLSARKIWSATVAMIPEELSTWIGECFYPRELIGSQTHKG